MIYLVQKIVVPKYLDGFTPSKLVLEHLTTKNTKTIYVADTCNSSSHYEFDLTGEEISDGQYRFQVETESGTLLSSGIAQKGNFDATVTEYNQEKTFMQYGE